MSQRLTRRDRALLVYVLWPAALIILVIWAVVPLARTLAAARGALEAKHAEVVTMRSDIGRAGVVGGEHARLRAEVQQFRQRILTEDRAVEPVIALQNLIEGSGLTLRSVRVGEIRALPEAERALLVEAILPVEATASGTYQSFQKFLRRWAGTNALKLIRLELSRDDESGQLHAKLLLNGFVATAPQRRP
jgi:hypothetical protein